MNEENGYKRTPFGFKDKIGNFVLPPIYSEVKTFSEGIAAVADSNHYWGFMDAKGKLVIPYQFNEVSEFYGGIAAFSGVKGDKNMQGFINHDGNILIKLTTDGGSFVYEFSGFKGGFIQTYTLLPSEGNPHPSLKGKIDCTGNVQWKSFWEELIETSH